MALFRGASVGTTLTVKSTGYTRELRKARAEAKGWARGVESDVQGVHKRFSAAGAFIAGAFKTSMLAGGAGAAIGIGYAVKAGTQFDAKMSRVKALSGATGDSFKALRDQAIDLGAKTSFSASQAADAMALLGAAGLKTNQIIKAMPGVLDAAAASGEEMTVVAEIMTNTMTSFGLAASKTTHIADVLAHAANDTNASIADIGETFKYAAGPAHALGFSLEQVAGMADLMAKSGIKASQAGTSIRMGLLQLGMRGSLISDKTAAKLDSISPALTKIWKSSEPVPKKLHDVVEAMQGMDSGTRTVAGRIIFGGNAISGMNAILQSTPAKLDKVTHSFHNVDGEAHKMGLTMRDNVAGAFENLKGSAETLGIAINDTFKGPLKGALQFGADIFNQFTEAVRGPGKVLPKQMGFYHAFARDVASSQTPIQRVVDVIRSLVGDAKEVGSAIVGFGTAFMQGFRGSEGAGVSAESLSQRIKILGHEIAAVAKVWLPRIGSALGTATGFMVKHREEAKQVAIAIIGIVAAIKTIKAINSVHRAIEHSIVLTKHFTAGLQGTKKGYDAAQKSANAWGRGFRTVTGGMKTAAQGVWNVVKSGAALVQTAANYAWLAAKATASFVAQKAAAAANWAAQTAMAVASFGRQAIAAGIAALAIGGVAAATGLAAGAQWALNIAMDANPIGLIILGLAALATGLYLAFKHIGFVHDAFTSAFNWAKANWPLLLAILTGPIGLAALVIIRHWDDIKAAASAVWTGIKNAAGAAWDAIKNAAGAAKTWLGNHWKLILGILTGPFGLAVVAIATHWDAIKKGASTAYNWVKGRFDALVNVVTGLPGRIGSAASGMWDGIKDAFRSAINWVINAWNDLEFKLPSVTVPGIGKKLGGFTLDTPDIGTLATGGMIGGSGSGDRVPALLEPGEGVLNRNAVRGLGGSPFVSWANQTWSRFAGGGVAGEVADAQVRADRPPWWLEQQIKNDRDRLAGLIASGPKLQASLDKLKQRKAALLTEVPKGKYPMKTDAQRLTRPKGDTSAADNQQQIDELEKYKRHLGSSKLDHRKRVQATDLIAILMKHRDAQKKAGAKLDDNIKGRGPGITELTKTLADLPAQRNALADEIVQLQDELASKPSEAWTDLQDAIANETSDMEQAIAEGFATEAEKTEMQRQQAEQVRAFMPNAGNRAEYRTAQQALIQLLTSIGGDVASAGAVPGAEVSSAAPAGGGDVASGEGGIAAGPTQAEILQDLANQLASLASSLTAAFGAETGNLFRGIRVDEMHQHFAQQPNADYWKAATLTKLAGA